jgi:TonB family protein
MRNELQHIERIDQYLNNELSALDKNAFEQELQANKTLQTQLETQKLLKQAALRKAIKADIAKYGGSSMGFNWSKWLGITGIIVLIIGALWLGKDVFSTTENNVEQNQLVIAQKDSTNNDLVTLVAVPKDSISADKTTLTSNSNTLEKPKNKEVTYSEDTYCGGLKTWVKPDIQTHTIDHSKGATIEGKEGSLVIVPSDAFVDKNGSIVKETVTLEIVEALKVSDMIAYNLTTMNGDKPLQTGGMLYIQPYVNGEKVGINPKRPLYVEIPTDEYNPNMMAWNGKIDENGDVDWQNPQPLKRYLTKVDFDNLDFLPNGFEEAVAAGMPFKSYKKADKKLVDSLYYSIGIQQKPIEFNNNIKSDTGDYKRKSKFKGLRVGAGEFMRFYLRGKTVLVGRVVNEQGQAVNKAVVNIYQNGKLNKKPIYTNSNGEFIFKKLESGNFNVSASGSNNVYAYSEPFTAKGEDSIKIVRPLVLMPRPNGKWNPKMSRDSMDCYIEPQSIQTIKTDAFSNTFLATKEFEQRLKVLHQMPNAQELFDLYVNNLTKNLHEVDALVAAELNGENKKYFTDFAAQKLTNVKDANIYQDQLSAYYNKKKKENIEFHEKALDAYSKKSREELIKYQKELLEASSEYSQLSNGPIGGMGSSNISKTRLFNLSISLPIKKSTVPKTNVATATNTYATPWYEGGWMNIDAYLHLLGNNPLEKTIETGKEKNIKGTKVYQLLNTLKTIIPLTIIGTISKAKFPRAGTTGANAMSNTFALGIQKENGKLYFAKENYNPYENSNVRLEWQEVSEDQLMEQLRELDGASSPLMKELKEQQNILNKQLKIESQKTELKVEMDSIQSKIDNIEKALALERAFIQTLENVVNSCGVAISNETNSEVISFSEIQPEFPGGQTALFEFLSKNIVYPKEALEQGIGGKVYVQFTVETDGSITNITVLKSDHQLLNQAAVDVIRKMPKWGPATNEGSVIKVAHTLPINFQKY